MSSRFLLCFLFCLLLQLLKLKGMFLLQVTKGDFARQPNPTHREDAGLEVDMVKVPDDDGQESEEGFVTVNQSANVPDPKGKVSESLRFKPKSQTCQDHDRCAPNDGVILQLLNPVEPAKLRLFVAETQVALYHLPDVGEVFLRPHHVPQLFTTSWCEQVKQMPDRKSHQHDSANSVDDASQLCTAGKSEKPPCPT